MAVKYDALLGQIREDYWKRQPGGIKHSGHIATADADVDTVSPLLTIGGNTLNAAANNFLNTTQISQTIQTPVLNTLLVDAASNNGNTYVGQDGLSQIKSGNTSNYTGGVYGDVGAIYHTGSGVATTAAGVLGQVQLNGPGAITNAVALYGLALHLGSGSITTAADIYGRHIYWPGNSISVTDQYGFYVDTPIKVGGTATNNYGLYIGDQSGFATTLNYNLYSAGASSTNYLAGYVGIGGTSTSAKLHVDSTASAISGLVVKAQTNQYTFEYQKSDGTNLLRGVWDTGNFHHYLGGPLYYNLGGNNFVIDGNGYSNTGLIITGKAELKLDASIDNSAPNIRMGGGSYATAGVPLTTTNVFWNSVWGWNGSNGYTETSMVTMNHVMLSHTSGDSKLSLYNNSNEEIFKWNMADGTIGLLPASKTFTSLKTLINTASTYTVDYANAAYPVAFDYNATIIFKQNGFGFGSGFLFWNRQTITNDSGSTRTAGPMGGYVSQPVYQANGGTFSPSHDAGLLHSPTLSRVSSGTLNLTNSYGTWMQGAAVGTGTTLTNYIGHVVDYTGSISGTLTNSAGFASATLAGTNKTHVLLGTSTIPSGTWGIYQASTETNFFSGDINFVKETARTIQIADTTTAATAGAALTLLGAKGSNTTSGAGGAINITGGDGRQGNSAGGAVNHTGGTGVGLAAGGAVNIKGGNGFIGGNILIDVGGGFAGAVMKIGSVNATPIAIGNITPTAYLHFKAGAAAASSAPLKFTAGTNLTTAEAGAVEYDNTFYMTQSDATRRQVVLATNATKTTGGAPYTNDGYITVRIGGTDVKLMTTA